VVLLESMKIGYQINKGVKMQNKQNKQNEQNVVDLGSNKIIQIKPWKTKTKKEFLKVIKEKQDNTSTEDIINTLVLPYIEPNDIFFTDEELQYLLINIREISIKEPIEFSAKCFKCEERYKITKRVLNFAKYKKSSYPKQSDYLWEEIKNKNSLKEKISEYPDETKYDIEMLLHIKKILDDEVTSFEDTLEYFDDLDMEESEEMYNEYNEVKSYLELNIEDKCDNCGHINFYTFDTIPDFFKPLIPKG